VHPIECARSVTSIDELYVRTGAVSTDLRFSDLGQFCVATGGQQTAGLVLGELWISYEIEFFQPKIVDILDQNGQYAHYSMAGVSNTTGTMIGTAQAKYEDNIGLTMSPITNGFLFPPGCVDQSYIIIFIWQATSFTTSSSFTQSLSGCVSQSKFINNTLATFQAPFTGTTNGSYSFQMAITITNNFSPSIGFAANYFNTVTSFIGGDIFVMQVPTPLTMYQQIHFGEKNSNTRRIFSDFKRVTGPQIGQIMSENQCCCFKGPDVICTALKHTLMPSYKKGIIFSGWPSEQELACNGYTKFSGIGPNAVSQMTPYPESDSDESSFEDNVCTLHQKGLTRTVARTMLLENKSLEACLSLLQLVENKSAGVNPKAPY